MKGVLGGAATTAFAVFALTAASCTRSEPRELDSWLDSTLSKDLADYAPDNTKSDALDRYSYDFVFLVNTSQANAKSAAMTYAQRGVERFLGRRQQAQAKLGITTNAGSRFSLYAYQQTLHTGSDDAVIGAPLDDRYGNVVRSFSWRVREKEQSKNYPVAGGSNHIASRSALIRSLRLDPKRPTVIVQILTNPLSERTSTGGGGDEQGGGLAGTGFVSYATPGLPLEGDMPGGGVDRPQVHVWLYGPSSLERAEPRPAGASSSIPLAALGLIGLVAVVVAGAIAMSRRTPKGSRMGEGAKRRSGFIQVVVDQNEPGVTLDLEQAIDVWGPGPDMPAGVIEIPIGSNQKLFTLKHSADGVRIVGIGWTVDSAVMKAVTPVVRRGESKDVVFLDEEKMQKRVSIKAA